MDFNEQHSSQGAGYRTPKTLESFCPEGKGIEPHGIKWFLLNRSYACTYVGTYVCALLLLMLLLLPVAACNGGSPQSGAPGAGDGPAVSGSAENGSLQPDESQSSAQLDKPAFYLDMLPELAPFNNPKEIVTRYYEDEFVDTLKPAKDYGRLYPFEGRFIHTDNWAGGSTYYGLVDEKGRMVVDPVYYYVYHESPYQDDEFTHLVLHYPVDKEDETAQKLLEDSYGDFRRHRIAFASIDGTWVSDIFYGTGAALYEDRIMIQDYENITDMYAGKSFYSLYDLQGNLIARGDGMIYSFHEGLGLVRHAADTEGSGRGYDYFNYIDKNGRTVIPGPFLNGDRFIDGRAYVTVGESWEERLGGIIDTLGNFIEGPEPDVDMRFASGWDYSIYYDEDHSSDNQLYGLKDKEGKIITPAEYSWISVPYEQGVTLTIGDTGDESHWLIDLQSGEEKQIDLDGAKVSYAHITDNNWCVANFEKPLSGNEFDNGVALLKDDLEYMFYAPDYGYSYVYGSHIRDDLFALNYNRYTQNNQPVYQTDVFDAARGTVIKSLQGYSYSGSYNDIMMIFSNYAGPGISRQMVLNYDFEPFFTADILGGESIKDIRHVADDVYSLRTTFYSGLIRENGHWLIRVYANTLD
jgi:hypothetical protein